MKLIMMDLDINNDLIMVQMEIEKEVQAVIKSQLDKSNDDDPVTSIRFLSENVMIVVEESLILNE